MRGDIIRKKPNPNKIKQPTPVKQDLLERHDMPAKKSRKILIWVITIILLIIILPIAWYFFAINVPRGTNSQNISFEIIENEQTMDIAQDLQEHGLIYDPYSFATYVYLNNIKLMPGIYYLRKNMNLKQILEPISKGDSQENKVTIIEGWRREEIGQLLAKESIVNYEDFMNASDGKEGYLFPDTYRFSKNSTATDIVKTMTDNFAKRTSGLDVTKDDVTLASIVEREAKKDEDYAKIAGVYENRLKINMKLDADPTVQYAKGNWNGLVKTDYTTVKSDYNTYLHKGLPPTPICNPGLKSIKAVLNPEQSNYYYFVTLDNGTTLYAQTLAQQNENIKKNK